MIHLTSSQPGIGLSTRFFLISLMPLMGCATSAERDLDQPVEYVVMVGEFQPIGVARTGRLREPEAMARFCDALEGELLSGLGRLPGVQARYAATIDENTNMGGATLLLTGQVVPRGDRVLVQVSVSDIGRGGAGVWQGSVSTGPSLVQINPTGDLAKLVIERLKARVLVKRRF